MDGVSLRGYRLPHEFSIGGGGLRLNPVGPETRVNYLEFNDDPRLSRYRARRFNAVGEPLGPDFDLNSTLGGRPGHPPLLGYSLVAASTALQAVSSWSDFRQLRRPSIWPGTREDLPLCGAAAWLGDSR